MYKRQGLRAAQVAGDAGGGREADGVADGRLAGCVARRNHRHRNPPRGGVLVLQRQELEAVAIGHDEVEQHGVRALPAQKVDGLAPVAGGQHAVAAPGAGQDAPEQTRAYSKARGSSQANCGVG